MSATIRLYEQSPPVYECKAKVIDQRRMNNLDELALDQTIFYPEGGGQPSDRGLIGDAQVSYVYIEDEVIWHQVDHVPSQEEVWCQIDREKRWDLTQQHSGEHLLSGVFLSELGVNNVGFHMSNDYCTIDMEMSLPSWELVHRIESKAMEYIFQSIPVTIYQTDQEHITDFPIRKAINTSETIRVVQMGDADCCACCGTHVTNTGQIGLVKIIKFEMHKKRTRFYFVAGKRAFSLFHQEHQIISELRTLFSAEVDQLSDRIHQLIQEQKNKQDMLSTLEKSYSQLIASQLPIRYQGVVYHNRSFDFSFLLRIEKEITKATWTLVYSEKEKKASIRNQSDHFHVGNFLKRVLDRFDGKGGGGPHSGQIIFSQTKDLIDFVSYATDQLAAAHNQSVS